MTRFEFIVFFVLWGLTGLWAFESFRVKTYLAGCKMGWWLHQHQYQVKASDLKKNYGLQADPPKADQ